MLTLTLCLNLFVILFKCKIVSPHYNCLTHTFYSEIFWSVCGASVLFNVSPACISWLLLLQLRIQVSVHLRKYSFLIWKVLTKYRNKMPYGHSKMCHHICGRSFQRLGGFALTMWFVTDCDFSKFPFWWQLSLLKEIGSCNKISRNLYFDSITTKTYLDCCSTQVKFK